MPDARGWFRRLLGSKREQGRGPEEPLPVPPLDVSFAADHNDFALALYEQLRRRRENLFFSPLSVRAVLAMAMAGARGETAEQMGATLRVSTSDESLHAALAALIGRLAGAGPAGSEILAANSLWYQEGTPLQRGFQELIARHYAASLHHVDFSRGAESIRLAINKWSADHTRKMIRELIPPNTLTEGTRLVLVNAVLFKGTWLVRFPEASTGDERFHTEGGEPVQAPLMRLCAEVRYRDTARYQAVDLAYGGSDLSMLVLVPKRETGLEDLENMLSAPMFADCLARMRTCEVELFLPRFKLTWGTVNLRDWLVALGMTVPFAPDLADFSGINGLRPPILEALHIEAVLHQGRVVVDEAGTVAAAASAVLESTMTLYPREPVPLVRADHPFLFAIYDRKLGAILFLGRVADPTRES
jgi:serpin B